MGTVVHYNERLTDLLKPNGNDLLFATAFKFY